MQLSLMQQPTMTSREIAELTGKRHDSVKRTIDTMSASQIISLPQIVEVQNPGPGPAVITEYLVCERDSYVIVAQLSPEFTARLVDRWRALESPAASQFQIPTTLAGALRLAAEQADVIEAQALALAAAAPAVEFVARYADSTGVKGFRQVCKLLGAKENDFREFLLDKKIMYRLGGEWMPHAAHLDTGRFVVKAGTAGQNGHAFNSAKFTPKGVNWVAGEYAKYQLEQKQ